LPVVKEQIPVTLVGIEKAANMDFAKTATSKGINMAF
jgi:hypothetical protein